MVIQTQFGNEYKADKTRTYRDVKQNVNLAQYVEGFYAQRESYRWGVLVQLKGKDRIILRTFGKWPNGETVNGNALLVLGQNRDV